MKKISILGLWHQGIVGAACLASAGHKVVAADMNAHTVASLSAGKSPIYEPGLDDLIVAGIDNGNLSFTSDISTSVMQADIVLLMIDTPVDDNDAVILDTVFEMIDEIAPSLKQQSNLHLTSQMPVGSTRRIKSQLENLGRNDIGISYSPENLQLGDAIGTFMQPRLPMIGADEIETFEKVKSIYISFEENWKFVGIETAEMTKHALNAYLAASVCFGNELGTICDEVGADGHTIAMALRKEPRIGQRAMIIPGLAFSGGTLARDVQTLRKIAAEATLDVPMLDGIMTSNAQHNNIVIRKLKAALGTLTEKKVTVLGLTYKPETSTLRRSAAIEIVETLSQAGATVASTDPMADAGELEALELLGFSRDVEDALVQSNAIVLMTPWQQYSNLDFGRIKASMCSEPVVIDPFGFWDRQMLETLGFRYLGIGKGFK